MSKRIDTEQLWKLCFGDSDEFIQFYFDRKYKEENTFTLYKEGKLICVLQAIPYIITINNLNYSAAYISGACTHPQHRNQHCMSNLLKETLEELKKRNIDFVFLIPQEQWLYEFYAKFGFKPLLTNHIEKIQKPTIQPVFSVINNSECVNKKKILYDLYKKHSVIENCINHTEQDFYDCMDEVYVSKGTILTIETENKTVAFATANETRLEIFAEEKYHNAFIHAYCDIYKKETATVLTQKSGANSTHGMICTLANQIQIKTPIFANLLME